MLRVPGAKRIERYVTLEVYRMNRLTIARSLSTAHLEMGIGPSTRRLGSSFSMLRAEIK